MAVSEFLIAVRSSLEGPALADAEELVREAGWNQVAADWRLFMRIGHVHAAQTAAGRIVATAATLPYGRFGWIGMVLVAKAFRRRGLATLLMQRCIDELQAAGCVPLLDATPDGRAVYRTLGFVDTWRFQRLAGMGGRGSDHDDSGSHRLGAENVADSDRLQHDAARKSTRTVLHQARASPVPVPPPGVSLHPIDDRVWPAVCAYDGAAFGADRSVLLADLRARMPSAAWCAMEDSRVVGIVLGRDGRTTAQIGPLIAENDAIARALLARALADLRGPVYVDLADDKAEIRDWLAARGFAPQRPFTRMVMTRATGFDDARRTYAVVGPEFG